MWWRLALVLTGSGRDQFINGHDVAPARAADVRIEVVGLSLDVRRELIGERRRLNEVRVASPSRSSKNDFIHEGWSQCARSSYSFGNTASRSHRA